MDTNEKFHEIYMKYAPMLRVIAKRCGIPYDEIDDVLQETFEAFYTHYPLTWPNYKIKAMLTRIMKNRCIDYLRRKECMQVICFDPVLMQDDMFKVDGLCERDNLSILLSKLEYQDVMEALKSMRKDWAEVFELYVIEGRAMDEVSHILNLSEAACRQRLCRGRKYLRQCLGQKEESRHGETFFDPSSQNNVPDSGEMPENA